MDTQLVRLDAPYNLICNEYAEFGLHIATLIVVNDKKKENVLEDGIDAEHRGVYAYPVVTSKHELGGMPWMNSSLENCRVICEMMDHPFITLRTFRDLVEWIDVFNRTMELEAIILKLASALDLYEVSTFIPPRRLFNVPIEFDIEPGRSVIASSVGSPFYFFASYIYNEEEEEKDIRRCMKGFNKCRKAYLAVLGKYDMVDITFSTQDKKYQHYVDELNKMAHASGK